jgi:hypothetical protein
MSADRSPTTLKLSSATSRPAAPIGTRTFFEEGRMKQIIVGLCLALAVAPCTFAQDKSKDTDRKASVAAEKTAKSDTQKSKSGDRSADKAAEKSAKKEPTEKQKAAQSRMKDCAAKAGDRKGDERKKFMSECLSKA